MAIWREIYDVNIEDKGWIFVWLLLILLVLLILVICHG